MAARERDQRAKSNKPDRNSQKLAKNSHKSGKQRKQHDASPTSGGKKRTQKDRKKRDDEHQRTGGKQRRTGKRGDKGKEKDGEKTKRKQVKLDEDNKLISGCRIGTSRFTFVVKKLLGSGGFGDVYLVEDDKAKQYAVKTEYRDESVTPRLHFEVKAYAQIGKLKETNPERVAHLLEMFDSACTDILKYIVISLVGPSIEDLIAKTEISWSTACRISIEMFDGLQELHALGFVHRDVKPANYSIGLGAEKRRVFLVDLGMTTCFPTDVNKLQNKSKYKFIGTLKYAPRAVHVCRRQTRCNDLEAWLYSSMEMFTAEVLPWRNSEDEKEVGKMKDDFFKNPKSSFAHVPARYVDIIKIIDEIEPLQTPDYKEIRNILLSAAKDEDTVFDEPFEWEIDELAKKAAAKKGDENEREDDPKTLASTGTATDRTNEKDSTRHDDVDCKRESGTAVKTVRSEERPCERTCEE